MSIGIIDSRRFCIFKRGTLAQMFIRCLGADTVRANRLACELAVGEVGGFLGVQIFCSIENVCMEMAKLFTRERLF